MRAPLLAVLVLVLAACDTTPGEGDVLVGDWTAVETRSDVVVESRIDQQVPDFGAEGVGDLAVAGTGTVPLTIVTGVGPSDADVVASSGEARLRLRESAFSPSEAVLRLDDSLYTARLAVGADLFTFADGLLTVADLTLVGVGGARRTVHLGGARTVPPRTLRAGEAARVGAASATPLRPDLGAYAIRLRGDGTARRREITSHGEAAPTFGRWEAPGPDALTLTFDGASVGYRYRFDDGALVLERDGEAFTEGEVVRGFEAELFAEPGSLTRVQYRAAVVLRSAE